jgi:dTDP-glucose 4,6-dehydratase/UDP-glucuronate decarboxylase
LRILVRGRAGEPYNIGTEAPEVSMRDLAERVAVIGRDELDYRGRVVFKTSDDPAYLTDNPTRRCPDIRKARQELGYAPQVDLDEGLRRSIVWYRDNQQ